MVQKIISIIVLLCLCLALYSYAFADGKLEFQSAFDTVIGGIHNFGTTMSGLFDDVIDFFTNVFSGITDFWNKVVEFFGGETAWEVENGSTYTNVL